MSIPGRRPAARGGSADVVYVLLLVQAGAGLLAMLGELIFMGGSPLYVIAPVTRTVASLVFAALVVRGRRGALIAVLTLQVLTLLGFCVSALLGLLPALSFTPTLTGLLTGVALPVALIMLCGRLLVRRAVNVPPPALPPVTIAGQSVGPAPSSAPMAGQSGYQPAAERPVARQIGPDGGLGRAAQRS